MASVSPTISSDVDPLEERFARWRAEGHRALIPYITAGYPTLDATADLLDALVAAGVDVVELGVPFSDPVADGPTIQRSSQRALENGASLEWTLDLLREFRVHHETPVVLFTYLNPVLRYGVNRFIEDATEAGAQGLLLTDLPVGSDDALERRIEASPLALIRLIAPTTPPARAQEIARRAQGFIYYIARMGVTGATAALRASLGREVETLRAVTTVPVAVGFGISTATHAAEVARVADGVVVGSALIDALDRGGIAEAARLIGGMRTAIDGL